MQKCLISQFLKDTPEILFIHFIEKILVLRCFQLAAEIQQNTKTGRKESALEY